MKLQNLIFLLIIVIFVSESQAMKPSKGGATGGAAATPDISKCELNASKQTKVKLTGKDGKVHFICTGQAICGGSAVPVSCKVSEREPCPTAKKCIEFSPSIKDLEERENLINSLLKKFESKYKKKLTQSSIEAFKSKFPKITSWPKSTNEEEGILKIMNNWGDCRDDCYDVRVKCLNRGTPNYECDRGYDTCVAWCDRNHLTIENLFGSP